MNNLHNDTSFPSSKHSLLGGIFFLWGIFGRKCWADSLLAGPGFSSAASFPSSEGSPFLKFLYNQVFAFDCYKLLVNYEAIYREHYKYVKEYLLLQTDDRKVPDSTLCKNKNNWWFNHSNTLLNRAELFGANTQII